MAFRYVCQLDDLWEGEMELRESEGKDVLMVWPNDGELCAYQTQCPHQDVDLIEGKFDGKTLTCRLHHWVFDACTGKGINPGDCQLTKYPLQIQDGKVFVDLDIEVRKFTYT